MIHQMIQMDLEFPISAWVRRLRLGRVFTPDTDVVLSDTTTLRPDLIFISNERMHIMTRANIQGAPDLVAEILTPSTSRRDWNDKMSLYESYGVPEYWIVYPVGCVLLSIPIGGRQVRATRQIWRR